MEFSNFYLDASLYRFLKQSKFKRLILIRSAKTRLSAGNCKLI